MGDDQQVESEAVISDVPSILVADFKFVNGILAERGWSPVNASHPSLCGTTILCIAQNNQGRLRLSAGGGAEAIRHW